MHDKRRLSNSIFPAISGVTPSALAIVVVFALTVIFTQSARAQTYRVLYNFSGGADGAYPLDRLTMDAGGNLYGTASGGRRWCVYYPCGTVFELTPIGSSWILTPLHEFAGGLDGAYPMAGVTIGPDGGLYGTTLGGELIYKLTPSAEIPPDILAGWPETIIYNGGGNGDLIADRAGNLYGVIWDYTVFELTFSNSHWTMIVLYTFNGSDGEFPNSPLVFDDAGNLYGTTGGGGAYDRGTIFQLTPSADGWKMTVLYNFTMHDGWPLGGLVPDPTGNLYGATTSLGGGGQIFKVSPSNGTWTFTVIYTITFSDTSGGSALVMDAVGNLYGALIPGGCSAFGSGETSTATRCAATDSGEIFKLSLSNGNWTYTSLHNFTGGSDGGVPSGVMLDGNGNLYGAASAGGAHSLGVVWEITP